MSSLKPHCVASSRLENGSPPPVMRGSRFCNRVQAMVDGAHRAQ
jgi:hypothetical protein